MADTMKTYPVVCPYSDCAEEFDADIPAEALLPDADKFDVACPECGTEFEIQYDATTDTLTLLPWEDDEPEDEA